MTRHRSRSRNYRRSRSTRRRSHNHNNAVGATNVSVHHITVLADALKATLAEQLPPLTWRINCQLAHGSPTVVIRDYQSVPELYKKIAQAFDISSDDIIFCTVNTFKPDMEHLFTSCIMNDDFLYVHVAGQACELEVEKTQNSLGMTIAENAVSRCFIKTIAESSVLDKLRPNISIGQLIQKINGVDVIGLRHYEITRMLRLIPVGTNFTITLVSPLQYHMGVLQPRSAIKKMKEPEDGTQSIRMKPDGGVVIEEVGKNDLWIAKMNELLEAHLGIHDDQLAMAILELAKKSNEITDLSDKVNESDLAPLNFPKSFLNNVWTLYNEHKPSNKGIST
ncbi:unnamed protein product [Auanema sp. JU1783]|nr:unnamed protein product [Auanema sp. JU1783]